LRDVLAQLLCLTLVFPPWLFATPAFAVFVDETSSRLPEALDGSYSVAAGDVDGDRDPDLFVANHGRSRLLLNDAAGGFSDESDARLPELGATIISAAFGDVDADDDADLALASSSGRNHLLINDGDGNFADESDTRLPPDAELSMGVQLGDVDLDGDLDLLVANRNSQNRLLINDGAGIFGDETGDRLPPDADPSYDVEVIDADGDGSPDLFIANYGVRNRLYINNGLGSFTDETDTRLPDAEGPSIDAAPADVDGDGHPDLVLADGGEGLRLLLNAGGGVFVDESAGRLPALDDFVVRVLAEDYDYDGDQDLFLANLGQDRLLVNDGGGVFSDETGAELPVDTRRSFGLLLGDLNRDLDADLLLATPGGQNRLLVNGIAFPRIRLATAPDYIEVGDTVTISVEVYDEDGIASTALSVDGDPVVLVGESASYVPAAAGVYVVTATSIDTLGTSATRSVSFLAHVPDGTAPQVTLAVDPLAPVVGEAVELQVSASDAESGVVSRGLSVDGVPVPLDKDGNARYLPTAIGDHTAVARATDRAGNEGSDTVVFSAVPDTELPVVGVAAAPDPVDVRSPVTLSVTASDNVGIASQALSVTGPSAPGGVALPIDGSGTATYTPYLPGTYTARYSALDPSGNEGTASIDFEATGVPDTTAPEVSLSIAPRTVAIGASVLLTVSATDDLGVALTRLEIDGTAVALDASGRAVYTPAAVGSYTVVASAWDATGNSASASDSFKAADPATDTTPPAVELASPAADSEVTAPAAIIGTVADENLVSYALEFAPEGESGFTLLASGDTPVANDVLGQLDPTLLTNGIVQLRLSATDVAGQTASTSVTYLVSGDLKVGINAIAFTDLQVPVSGIDLTIRRSYDNRVKVSRDFGYGWSLEILNLELQENGAPGAGWFAINTGTIFPNWELRPARTHMVVVTYPDGQADVFDMEAYFDDPFSRAGDLATVVFQPRPGTTSTLAPLDGTTVVYSGGNLMNLGFTTYNPSRYQLTRKDGTVLQINQSTGLEIISDRNGNSLSLNSNGIVHSTGKSVFFARDSQGRISSITDPMGNVLSYVYDANGDLESVTNQEGNSTQHGYDGEHNLLEVIDGLGVQALRAEYDESGRLVATADAHGNRIEITHDPDNYTSVVRDRLGNATLYEYNTRGDVVRTVDALGNTSLNSYDARGNLLSSTDPLGNVTSYTYDARDDLLTETDPLGNTTTRTYDALGNVLTLTDPLGNVTQYTYDAAGNQLTATKPSGAVTTDTYDAAGNLLTTTDALGNTSTYAYDAWGNVTSETDALGTTSTHTYDANGNQLTQSVTRTTPSGAETLTTTYVYDRLGQLTQTIDPAGNVTTAEYDAVDQQVASTDKLGRRTGYEFDGAGRPVRTTHPDGSAETSAYDAEGRLTASTDRAGRTTVHTYDASGRLIETTHPDGSVNGSSYDAAGRTESTTDARGNVTRYSYDAAGRQSTVEDAAGGVTVFSYDANGQVLTRTDANGNTTSHEYDADGRRTATIHPDGSRTTSSFDARGLEIAVTDEAGITTSFEYDALGRLIGVVDALGNQTSYAFDELGNRVAQTDALGRTTLFAYDALGHAVERTLPLGMSETMVFDAEGNLTARTDFNGNTTAYSYDVNNRRIQTTYPDATTVSFAYTASGQREGVTDARGTTSYTYDLLDRVTTVTHPDGATLSYSYDQNGNRSSVTTPAGTTAYTHDGLNRIATVTDPDGGVTAYAYDLAGRKTTTTYPNGALAEYTYDSLNRLTDLTNRQSGGAVIDSYGYTLGPAGNRTRVTEASGRIVDYTYDALYRIVSEAITDPALGDETITYSYDAVGNRVSRTDSAGLATYAYDANDRLLTETTPALTVIAYGYDDNGNLLSRSDDGSLTTDYGYDYEDRLLSAEQGASQSVHRYDADGVRVDSTRDGAVTHYLVDQNRPYAQVLEETDDADTVLASYVYGDDLVSQNRGGSWFQYHYDGLGSSRALTDDAEVTTDTYTYDAFGSLIARNGSTPNDYLFAGEQFDPQLGAYYLRSRYYDPAIGRFLAADTFSGLDRTPKSLHKYVYAGNDPVNKVDPSGEFWSIGTVLPTLTIGVVLNAVALPAYASAVSKAKMGPIKSAAKKLVDQAIRKLKFMRGDHLYEDEFRRFFYTKEDWARKTVLGVYQQMKGTLSGNKIKFRPGKKCKTKQTAYVLKADVQKNLTIYLCPFFHSQKHPLTAMGNPSKGETLVHELSHLLQNAHDWNAKYEGGYNWKDTQDKVQLMRMKALTFAYSYGFYCTTPVPPLEGWPHECCQAETGPGGRAAVRASLRLGPGWNAGDRRCRRELRVGSGRGGHGGGRGAGVLVRGAARDGGESGGSRQHGARRGLDAGRRGRERAADRELRDPGRGGAAAAGLQLLHRRADAELRERRLHGEAASGERRGRGAPAGGGYVREVLSGHGHGLRGAERISGSGGGRLGACRRRGSLHAGAAHRGSGRGAWELGGAARPSAVHVRGRAGGVFGLRVSRGGSRSGDRIRRHVLRR
jgi:RHS repeat-associated protein